jgi:cation transport ATPase
LKELGLEVAMISGDNRRTAETVGRELGSDRVFAEVLPEDKADYVARLRQEGKKVAMVGDGVKTPLPWPRPTSGSRSAPAPTSPSRPPTSC